MINYSYPVMTDGGDCYVKNTVVWSDLDKEISGSSLQISVFCQFEDERIQNLVDEGRARPYALVYCSRTDYRELFDITEHEFSIDSSKIAGTINVELSIIALEVIDCSLIGDLSGDYDGLSVSVPKFGYISKSDYSFSVSRELEPDSISICKFVKDNADRPWYDTDADFITIHLPEDLYIKLDTMPPEHKSIYTSIYFPPVLVDLISQYWMDSEALAQPYKWYEVIEKSIESNYPGQDLSEQDVSAYEVMTTIIDSLVASAAKDVYELSGGE